MVRKMEKEKTGGEERGILMSVSSPKSINQIIFPPTLERTE